MSVCYYGPNGQHEIFEDGTPCPKGWADHPRKLEGGDLSNAGEDLSDPHNVPSASEEALVEAAKPVDPFDHDSDGKPGGSLPKAKRGAKVIRRDPR